MKESDDKISSLCGALVMIESLDEARMFLNDLCTPQEIKSLTERWEVCQLLDSNLYTYRQINEITGTSLATITRVARFLKDEKNKGYVSMLKKIKEGKNNEKNI